eukprot:s1825_g10.t1
MRGAGERLRASSSRCGPQAGLHAAAAGPLEGARFSAKHHGFDAEARATGGPVLAPLRLQTAQGSLQDGACIGFGVQRPFFPNGTLVCPH